MQNIDIHTLLQHENTWIALSADKKTIIESAKTVEELEKKLLKKEIIDAIITFIPPADKSISP